MLQGCCKACDNIKELDFWLLLYITEEGDEEAQVTEDEEEELQFEDVAAVAAPVCTVSMSVTGAVEDDCVVVVVEGFLIKFTDDLLLLLMLEL